MIRLANLNDLQSIMEIVTDAVKLLKDNKVNQWQNGYPNIEVITKDINSKNLYVYCDNEKVVGFAYISSEEETSYEVIYNGSWLQKGKYIVVHRIAVKKEYLNKKIAWKLLTEAVNIARSNKIRSIRVDTHRDNLIMNNFLKKFGFTKCGEIFLVNYIDSDKLRIAYEMLVD